MGNMEELKGRAGGAVLVKTHYMLKEILKQ